MTPEVAKAVNDLTVVFVVSLGTIITALVATIGGWLADRRKLAAAQAKLRIRDGGADIEREELFNDFAKDCMQRVNSLAGDLVEVRQAMRDKEAERRVEREQWNAERKKLEARIDSLTAQLQVMRDERAEREIVITEQSNTIRSLQARVDKLEEQNRKLQAQIEENHT